MAAVVALAALSGPLALPGGAQDDRQQDASAELPTTEERRSQLSARLGQLQVQLSEAVGRAETAAETATDIDTVRLPANVAARRRAVEDRVAPERARRELVVDSFVRGDPRSRHLLETIRDGTFGLDAFFDDVLVRTAEEGARQRLRELDELEVRLAREAVELEAELTRSTAEAAGARAEAELLSAEKAVLEAELASVERQIQRLRANATGAPLTGVGTALDRPALAVKVDNLSPARPQSGLNQADLVYEELVEGGITRYIAVFQSTDAPRVGPVRSGRTSDLLILANLNRALYGASGGNRYVLDALRGANLVSILEDAQGVFFRDPDRNAPHNLYSSTTALYGANPGGTSRPPRLFAYRAPGDPVAGGRPAGAVEVAVGDDVVTYTWTGTGWLRSLDGEPETDAEGVPIAPENVILQFTDYGTSAADAASPEAVVTGRGQAWVLTGGQLVEASWERPFPEEATRFVGPDGQEVGLTPGRTWIPLPPAGRASVVA